MINIGTLGGPYSAGYGINDAGQVTGDAYISTNAVDAFLYRNGQMLDLGVLPGGILSGGFGTNNAG